MRYIASIGAALAARLNFHAGDKTAKSMRGARREISEPSGSPRTFFLPADVVRNLVTRATSR